jgi:hypothetical protein
MLLVV